MDTIILCIDAPELSDSMEPYARIAATGYIETRDKALSQYEAIISIAQNVFLIPVAPCFPAIVDILGSAKNGQFPVRVFSSDSPITQIEIGEYAGQQG